MSFEITPVEVWVGELEDRPGALASKLAHIQVAASANLEFAIARPLMEKPGFGVLYIAPLVGEKQQRVAREVGLHRSISIHAIRLVGPDRPGLIAGIAGTLAQADINITGLSAAAAEGRAIIYLRFESAQKASEAAETLRPLLCGAG